MEKRRMSLAVKMLLAMLVIVIIAFTQMIVISNGAYKHAVTIPFENKLANAEIPAGEMLPYMEYFTEYLGTEGLRDARSDMETDDGSVVRWLTEQPSKDPVVPEIENKGMLLDLVSFSFPVENLRESLGADDISVEIIKDGTAYRIYESVKGVNVDQSVNVFGTEESYSEQPASDFASPVFRGTNNGYELLRCVPLELSGGEGRLWIRYDMTEMAGNTKGYLWKIILLFLFLSALIFTASYFLLRRSVIKPVLGLAQAARDFTPEEDGTYSAEKVSKVNLETGDEIGGLSRDIRDMQEQIVENTGNLARLTAERERIATELNLAREIQASALPTEIPDRAEFELSASMTPARDVGGDFYDYFLIDEDHLAVVIADVSGKGIPAALFMMVSKALIKNQLLSGHDPASALEQANLQLYEGNDSMMFVTVWLAVLELSTGKGTACNAGHENPCLRRDNGAFEILKYKHGVSVGINPKARYENRQFELHPGDCVFVYTDGVPEATNAAQEMFGEARLADTLNRDADAAPEALVSRVHDAVDGFADGAPQFDDITMLCLKYRGHNK